MGMIGGQELLIILVIVILLFGAKKIPELAKGLGIGIKEFKKASKDVDAQLKNGTQPEDEKEKSGKNS
jgi:sec-independent protein translocase protein TatA